MFALHILVEECNRRKIEGIKKYCLAALGLGCDT